MRDGKMSVSDGLQADEAMDVDHDDGSSERDAKAEASIDRLLRETMGAEALTAYLARTVHASATPSPPSGHFLSAGRPGPITPPRNMPNSDDSSPSKRVRELMHKLEMPGSGPEQTNRMMTDDGEGFPNKRHLSPDAPSSEQSAQTLTTDAASKMSSSASAIAGPEEPAQVKLRGRGRGKNKSVMMLRDDKSYVAQLFELAQSQGWPPPTFTSEPESFACVTSYPLSSSLLACVCSLTKAHVTDQRVTFSSTASAAS